MKTLFALSRNRCAFQDPDTGRGCEERLTNPSWSRVRARICHISGWADGSARYDETLTDSQRNAFENLILLCPNHHALIDDLEPERFTAAVLKQMKIRAETQPDGTWTSAVRLGELAKTALAQMTPLWRSQSELLRLDNEIQEARRSYEWLLAADADGDPSSIQFHREMERLRALVVDLELERSHLRTQLGWA